MSGSKRSSWEWEESRAAAERARRERLAAEARAAEIARQVAARRALEEATQRAVRSQVRDLQPKISELVSAVRSAAAQVEPVTRQAFAPELAHAVEAAQRAARLAREAADLARLSGADLVARNVSPTSPVFTELGELARSLDGALAQVNQIRFRTGPESQRELVDVLSGVGRALVGASGLVGVADVRRWSAELNQLWSAMREGEFERVRREADELGARVAEQATQARARRDRHEDRLAVADALRDACRRLGYRELNPDEFAEAVEQDADTWRLVVDTRTKGRVTFYIETEQIRAESMVGVRSGSTDGDYCFAEFRRIEAELSAGHGLRTHFISPTIDRPDLPGRSAAELPAHADQAMGQSLQ